MKQGLFLLLLCCWHLTARATAPAPAKFSFAPNRGQWPAQVQFAGQVPGGWLYLEKGGFTYNLRESLPDDAPATTPLKGHVFRVRLLNAAGQPTAEGEQPQETYHNYFLGNDPRQWASEVPLFGAVRLRRVYPGVQMRWHAAGGQLEYDYELAPGTRPDVIRMRYEGLEDISLVDGQLQLRTSLGALTEQAPVAWQTTPAGERRPVACRFRLSGTEVGFAFPDGYDPKLPLTIDPTVVFATYGGSVSGMSANASALDVDGNVYYGGQSFGSAYPTTTGAFQTVGRSGNMVLSKLSPDGRRLLYATFLGGSSSEYPLDLLVSPVGELYVLGTTSSSNFPVTPNAYDQTFNGQMDLTITRFSRNGSALIGSTLLGGSLMEAGSLSSVPGTLRLDIAGNVLVGCATASANFPVLNAIKASHPTTDNIDGTLTKLSPTLSTLLWSTYLGGSNIDEVDDVRVSPSGYIYVCGRTASADFPSTAGALHQNSLGNFDGFVTKLSADGRTLLSSTYLGTSSDDLARYLDFDAAGQVYVAGGSRGQYPVSRGVFSSAYHPLGNLFVHCLDADLGRTVFSTSLGTGTLYPAGFTIGYCNTLYLAGYAQAGIAPTTPNAVQRAPRGLYACTLTAGAAALTYGSYYGSPDGSGQHQHQAAANEISPAGTLAYIECTQATNYPTTPNVYSSARGAGSNDGAVLKFDLTDASNFRLATAAVPPGCAPAWVQFSNATVGATGYHWTFGDGSPADTARTPRHLYTTPGTYTAQLVAYRRLPCGVVADSARLTVVVRPGLPAERRQVYLDCTGAANLTASSGPQVNFVWSTGSTDRVLVTREPGRYQLYRSSADSCYAPQEFEVLTAPPLLLPNIITANGDQLNRTFAVPVNLVNSRLRVFNRWGRQVYEAARYQNDWAGTDLPVGLYYYELKPLDCAKPYKGWLEIVR
jgi:hypothetical protein